MSDLRVLIIEDSPRDAELLIDELQRSGYTLAYERVQTAETMQRALASQPWDIVLSDHSILQFDALAALRVLQASGRDIPFVIVSGTLGEQRAVEAIKAGATDYVDKSHLVRLPLAVTRALAEAAERHQRRAAEEALREREQQATLELATAYEATLEGWARALDLRDHETEGHSRRVTELTLRLARRRGIDETALVHIRRGALLHDIGKMAIPDGVLLKPGQLTAEEWEVMRRHPVYAREFLAPIEFLGPALDIPYSHHERWDGTGYPQGLKGEKTPLAARLFAVADIWDALRSDRPYRRAMSDDASRQHIATLSGSHLDPRVVETFLELVAAGDVEHLERDLADRHQRRVLVVDDFNAELIKRWLTLDGYAIATATSGGAALEAIAADHFDLVLLDVMIPEPNGLAICRMIKDDPVTRGVRVIMMSGLEPAVTEPRTREAGADDYLPKPVDGYTLRARVRRVLERSSPISGVTG